jgi:hypothetical protein
MTPPDEWHQYYGDEIKCKMKSTYKVWFEKKDMNGEENLKNLRLDTM